MNKKSQVKIQEMAFMIVALVFFFGLVALFGVSILYSGIYERAGEISENRVLNTLVQIADTPELSCTGNRVRCIDSDKLISMVKGNSYSNFWPFSSLSVIKSSGFNKGEKELRECSLANYPDCDVFRVYDNNVKNERVVGSFVALCMKEFENGQVFDRCELARVIGGSEIGVEG